MLGWICAEGRVHAQSETYAGQWRATPLQIRNTIQSWGDDCPPRLPPTQTEPGGAVQIAQSGDHLTFSGAVRGSTRTCWSERPSLRKLSNRYDPSGRWTIVCRTRDETADKEEGRYTFTAQGNQLSYVEETNWDWRLRDSHCIASRRATRTFTRVGAAPATEPEPEPEPRPSCTPGDPSRLTLRPARTQIEPGGEICLRARVVDAQGCPTGSRVAFQMNHADGLVGTMTGRCFRAGATAAEAEGDFQIEARSGSLRATAVVVVRSEDLSDLTARRTRDRNERGLDAAETQSSSGFAARAVGGQTNLAIIAGAAGGVVLLGLVVLVWRRKKSPSVLESAMESAGGDLGPGGGSANAASPADAPMLAPPVQKPTPPSRRICPKCGLEQSGTPAQCPNDGTAMVDPDSAETRAKGMICPTCRRGYPADATTCSNDRATLVPYVLFTVLSKAATQKVCPQCGTPYDASQTFCGKDGATLVERGST